MIVGWNSIHVNVWSNDQSVSHVVTVMRRVCDSESDLMQVLLLEEPTSVARIWNL